MTFWGSIAALPDVWALADLSLGILTVINVAVILVLTPTIVAVTKDYNQQLQGNKQPRFNLTKSHNVQGYVTKNIWK